MKTTAAFTNTALLGILSLVVAAGIGFGKLLVHINISESANNTKRIESRITANARRLAEANTLVTAEQSVTALLRRNNDWKLGLVPPRENQIIRVTAPVNVEQLLSSRQNAEIFSETAQANIILPDNLRAAPRRNR